MRISPASKDAYGMFVDTWSATGRLLPSGPMAEAAPLPPNAKQEIADATAHGYATLVRRGAMDPGASFDLVFTRLSSKIRELAGGGTGHFTYVIYDGPADLLAGGTTYPRWVPWAAGGGALVLLGGAVLMMRSGR
jgi:hypothetical protein